MKKVKFHWKIVIVIAITLISWLLFPFFTYGTTNILNIFPLVVLIIQIFISYLSKHRKLLIFAVFNPVAFFAILYIVKPIVNHINRTPTIIRCCYFRSGVPSFDQNKSVYLDYYDDDCDWSRLYYYTLDINNITTYGLITLFGNSIKRDNKK